MNNINKICSCRGCGATDLKIAWLSPPLPIHLWPVPKNAFTCDQETTVFVCNSCGLAQLNDMTPSFVESLYDEGVCVMDEQGNQEDRKTKVLAWGGQNFYKNKVILELGGGTNSFINVVPEASEKWIADFKPTKEAFNIADNVIEGNFENITLPEKKFDIICGYLIYEHFVNPLKVTKKITPALKDDGVLIVEVPNLHWLHSDLPHYMVFHQHQSIFTLGTLNFMMAKAQLECKAVFSNHSVIYAAYQKNPNVRSSVSSTEVETALKKIQQTGYLLNSVEKFIQHQTKLLEANKPSIYGAGGSMSLFLAYTPSFRNSLRVAFDRDPRKIGKCVPGTSAEVMCPFEMNKNRTDAILVLTNELSKIAVGEKIENKTTVTDIINKLYKGKKV